MGKWFVLLLAVCAVIVFSGCVQVNSSDAGSMNIHPETVAPTDDYRPLYSIDSTQKVSAESNVKCLFWIFTWGSDNAYADNASISRYPILGILFPFLNAKETAAKAAFYKACKQANCDAVVAARYEVTFEDYIIYKKMNVEVKGFPARLTGVETVKPMPYYIDGEGKVVVMEKMVKPVRLFEVPRSTDGKNKYLVEMMGALNLD